MATTTELLTELNGFLEKESYQKAVDVCNKIVAKTPTEQIAYNAKVLALIRMNKFDKALEVASRFDHLQVEAAYCHYKLKNEQKAIDVLASLPSSPAVLHLKAQAHYRLNQYNECIALYEQLLAQAAPTDDTIELKTNLIAAYAAAGRGAELSSRGLETEGSYEIAFNKSFVTLQSDDIEAAQTHLNEADRLCRETFSTEGYSPAEIEQEALVVQLQHGYIQQLAGQEEEALETYLNVVQTKPKDVGLSAIAANNIATIQKQQDLFDSIKRLKAISQETLKDKCTPVQHETILANLALLWSWMKKLDECQEVLQKLKSIFPNSSSVAPIQLYLALGTGETKPTADTLKKALDIFKNDTSVNGQLCLAHVYILLKEPGKAADTLRSIESLAHSAGTVATLVALYDQAQNPAATQQVLSQALAFHAAQDSTSGEALAIQEGDGAYQLAQGNYAAAASRFESLLSSESLTPEMRLRCMAKLVVAISFVDATAAETRSALLPRIASASTDPEALIKSRAQRKTTAVAPVPTKKRGADNPERIARKRAKRREKHIEVLKSRQEYYPNVPPHPERWLPRKQRSRGNRRHKNKFVGAQGSGMGSQKDALKLDAAARAAAKKESATHKAHVVSGPSAMERKALARKRR
ncbi:signal recognition particle [Thraustotheca clavata]|uniref:Signal recognition particle subunit SRP72 n=1 Tax=Thraustotheca clavata TaxID=74557 RepID=A0A1V9ZZ34_9STRA|nr:signal recognition particle [Thraustotheca clavata]